PAPKTNSNPVLLPPKPASRPVVKASSPPLPPPVTFPRYSYKSPSKPRPGDHKAAASVFNEGHKYEQAQQYADAMNSYQTAAAVDPGWFEAQYNYGVLAFRQRDFEHALAADEMALAIQPDSVDTRYNFALALKSAGYALDAVNELKKVIAASPKEARAHLALGNLYAKEMNDLTQARAHYLKVLELDPHN